MTPYVHDGLAPPAYAPHSAAHDPTPGPRRRHNGRRGDARVARGTGRTQPAAGRRPRRKKSSPGRSKQYFPKLTMATAFGPEGCVIMHMLAEIEPGPTSSISTPATSSKRRSNCATGSPSGTASKSSCKRADTTVDAVRSPARRAALQDESRPVLLRSQGQGAAARAVVGWNAWMSGIRRDQSPATGPASDRRLGQEVRPGEDQPAGQLDQEGRLEADHRREHSVQSAARPGLHQHRLLALHAGRDVRRRRTGRPLERHRPRPSAACTPTIEAMRDRCILHGRVYETVASWSRQSHVVSSL